MSFANPSVSDIIATTIEKRSKKIADNVTNNNALLKRLQQKGRARPFSGGRLIYEELSFAQNGNAGYYSGYDLLPVAAQDVISAAQFDIKQAACPVVVSGLELLQNAGPEQMIDLVSSRIAVAESTMQNLIANGVYSDGTGSAGKQIVGLDAAVSTTPALGTYGGIDRSVWAFWRNVYDGTATAATIQAVMNSVWSQLVRGADRPDLIPMDGVFWNQYIASLQAQQRFTSSDSASLGFPTIKYMDADCVLDGGIGGNCPSGTAFMLNTDYIHYRPHSARNFVSLSPNKRYSINQDAEVQILAWAGALTCSGAQFQGRIHTT